MRPRHIFKIHVKPLDGSRKPEPVSPLDAAGLDWPAYLALKAEIERVYKALREQNEPQQLGLPEAVESNPPRLEGF